MLGDNLRYLFRLYTRPRAAMVSIVDEGSVVLGALGVLGVALLLQVGSTGPALLAAATQRLQPASAAALPAAAARARAADGAAGGDEALDEEDSGEYEPDEPTGAAALALGFVAASGFSTFGKVAALAVLYVPASILVAGLFVRRGSFGVALTRDYGALAACTFFAWTASQLPFAVAGLLVPPQVQLTALGGALPVVVWIVSALAFGGLMVVGFDVALGLDRVQSLATAALASVSLLAQGALGLLASPFALYFAWLYLRGELGDIQSAFGARRRFRRHLEAATINPRDSEAHLQLGLIHVQRRQYDEAIGRFQRTLEIDPDECDAHYQLGRVARLQGRPADAIRHFEAVVSRDPAHAHHEVWREVGGTYLEAGDVEHARPCLERFAEHRAWDPEGMFLLGEARQAAGDADGAREAWERCAESARTAPDYRKGELRQWRRRAEQRLAVRR